MSIDTNELLEFLKKRRVKKAILEIVREDKTLGVGGFSPEQDEAKAIVSNPDKKDEIKELEKEIEMLKGLVEKWKKCFNDEKDTNTNLKEEKSKLQKEIKDAKSQKKVIENEILALESKLKNSKQETKKYKEPFEEQLNIYELYKNLDSKTKTSLKGIFKDDTLNGFFACGVQEKNINSFWEYLRIELIEDRNSDIKNLIKIFEFLFEKYLMAYPMYKVQDVQKGDEFKTEKYIKDSHSLVSGTISKVLLRGWINSKNSKIVKKSVVRI